MRNRITALIVGVVVGVSVGGASVAVADVVNDRRDAITCSRSAAEDDRFMRSFTRLDDGRARIVFACPSS